MQKIYINKETNIVEQIFTIKDPGELPDEYYDWCYSVIDETDTVKSYGWKYNKDTETFEPIVGWIDPEILVIPNETEKLMVQIQNLQKELEATQSVVDSMLMNTVKEVI